MQHHFYILEMYQIHICMCILFRVDCDNIIKISIGPWSKSSLLLIIVLLLLALIFKLICCMYSQKLDKIVTHALYGYKLQETQRSKVLKWAIWDDHWQLFQLYTGKALEGITRTTKPIQSQVIQLSLSLS